MPHPGTPNVLSEVIRRVVSEGWTTQTQLADLAAVSDATVSRWATDEAQPRWDHVHAITARHPDIRVRRAFAALMPAPEEDEAEFRLDVNNDGKVDAADAEEQALQILDDSARLQRIIQAIREAGDLSQPIRRDLSVRLREAGEQVRADGDLLVRLSLEVQERRRQAGPPRLVGQEVGRAI